MRTRSDRALFRRRGLAGFTLFETILVIALLALASVTIMKMQPSIFGTQTNSRDQYVGLEVMRGCAERMLAVRRKLGYANVTSTLCNGMGGIGGFAANPTVTLKDAANATVTTCSSASCTATIVISKTAAPAASLSAITLQFGSY